jgi:hypothetical protein
MSNIAQNRNINEYVLAFIQKVCEENEYDATAFFESWNSEENQQGIVNMTKVSKGGKRVKDPNKPKRGKSAYLFFCNEERSSVKNDMPDAKATEITAELGSRWKILKASTKASDKKRVVEYEAAAADDKTRYIEEMKDYKPPTDEELLQGKKQRRKKKDKNAPKRGKSAYIFFCADKRAEVKEYMGEGAKAADVTARLGEMWNELKNDENRSEELNNYIKQAALDKERYDQEISDYIPDSDDEDKNPVPKAKTGKKSSAKKSSGKKGPNGYTYFCRENRKKVKDSNPEWKAVEVTKQLSLMWKNLSEEEQQEWKENAQESTA